MFARLDEGPARERILDPKNRPAIVIGMDVRPIEEAMDKDLRNSLVTAGVIFLLALTGVVSLFWVQNYMNSRKLLQDIRAVASEIVRNLPVGTVAVSEDGKISFINGVACGLPGLPLPNNSAITCPRRSLTPTGSPRCCSMS